MGIIVDTCIWIDVERGRISPADIQLFTQEEPIFLTPITIAELAFGVGMATNDQIRNQRAAALERLKKKPILTIDEETGAVFGRVSSTLRRQGRGADFRVQVIWIASQAIQHNFPILTGNLKDFEDIPGVRLMPLIRQ